MSEKSFPHIVFEKKYKYVSLFVDDKGKTYLLWHLTPKQLSWFGRKLFFLLCFKQADLCERHLKRPHLTCVTCKLLKVVTGKMPLFYPVIVRQIWQQSNMGVLQSLFFKEAVSLAESLS